MLRPHFPSNFISRWTWAGGTWVVRGLCENPNCVRVRHLIYQQASPHPRQGLDRSDRFHEPCAPLKIPALSLNDMQKERKKEEGGERQERKRHRRGGRKTGIDLLHQTVEEVTWGCDGHED